MADGVLPLELEDPKLIGGYRLRGRLGVGGMGVVYLAGSPGSYVAVKTMRAADLTEPEARARFTAEAQLARNLDCGYTARVVHDGSAQDFPYLVTDYIPGPSLAEAVQRDGPLSETLLLAVAMGVADALAQIHAAGIAHRDIKPANILLAEQGPRIIDFGIAQQPEIAEALTRTGMVMGSPGWVAPERLTGGRATFASDIFCWGLLVAYAGTGRHPFGPGSDSAHISERILSLSPDLADFSPPLRELVDAALAKDPVQRPKASEILHDLLGGHREATAPHAITELWTPSELPPTAEPLQDPPTQHPSRLAVAAVILGALTASVTLGSLLDSGTDTSTQPPQIITTPGPTVTTTTTLPSSSRAGYGANRTATQRPSPAPGGQEHSKTTGNKKGKMKKNSNKKSKVNKG
ncbi:MAG: serine/threonine-protein kinase [Streptosporangiaceae bacterium]